MHIMLRYRDTVAEKRISFIDAENSATIFSSHLRIIKIIANFGFGPLKLHPETP
jgi:hypothetical protein